MEQLRAIRPVLARALNPNQILILSRVNGIDGITSLLNGISDTTGVPLSTLKLNAKVLKDIGLIRFNGSPAELTDIGRLIVSIMLR